MPAEHDILEEAPSAISTWGKCADPEVSSGDKCRTCRTSGQSGARTARATDCATLRQVASAAPARTETQGKDATCRDLDTTVSTPFVSEPIQSAAWCSGCGGHHPVPASTIDSLRRTATPGRTAWLNSARRRDDVHSKQAADTPSEACRPPTLSSHDARLAVESLTSHTLSPCCSLGMKGGCAS